MRLTSKKMSSKRKDEGSVGSLIAQIAFEDLEKKISEIRGQPIICGACGAALLNAALIQEDKSLGRHFKCEFCATINKIDIDIKIPLEEEIEYIQEPSEIQETKKPVRAVAENIIACIDVSGSMSGRKIEAVKQSLIQTVQELAKESTSSGFGLITFTSDVKLYNSSGKIAAVIERSDASNEEKIRDIFRKADFSFEDIKTTEKQWITIIKGLGALYNTALGPAVVGGVELLRDGGRIILLTDGMANEGVGRLSGYSRDGREFYTKLGEDARNKDVTIELVGVTAGNKTAQMQLEVVGELANQTEGDIYYVDVSEVGTVFDALSESDAIARKVNVRVYLPPNIEPGTVTGGVSFRQEKNHLNVRMSSVNPDRSFCIQFNPKSDLKPGDEIPLQAQIEYQDLSGQKRTRIVRSKVQVIAEEKEVFKEYNTGISDIFNVQRSSGRKTRPEEGARQIKSYQSELRNVMKDVENDEAIQASLHAMDDELKDLEEQAEMERDRLYSAKMSKVRYSKKVAERMDDRAKRKKKK
ncbi:MAG: VWA domain-containing protein [Candidatus Hodarchaeota archaeon]